MASWGDWTTKGSVGRMDIVHVEEHKSPRAGLVPAISSLATSIKSEGLFFSSLF